MSARSDNQRIAVKSEAREPALASRRDVLQWVTGAGALLLSGAWYPEIANTATPSRRVLPCWQSQDTMRLTTTAPLRP